MKARVLSMLIGSVLAGGVQAQSAPQAQAPLPTGAAAPVYQAEPCCNLCPAALVKENYKGDVLSTLWPLVAGKNGWVFRARTDFATEFGPSPESMAMLKQFSQALKKRGTQLMVVYLPSRGLMHEDQSLQPFDKALALANYQAALQRFRDIGVAAAPLDQLVDQVQGDFYLKRDLHWSPTGAEATARVVAKTVSHYPFYDSLPSEEYQTEASGYTAVNGNWQRAIGDLCQQNYPLQYTNEYQTTPDSDLLEAEVAPELVLIGTSFSASANQRTNFEGFLRQYLGKDILNMALSGGEESGAWLEYLPSGVFQEKPPKMILWELPAHYLMKDKSLFRQLIPLVNNGCEGKKSLLSSSQKIRPGSGHNELVFSTELLKRDAGDLVMELQLSDPTVHDLNVTAWYGNGADERFTVRQNQRANTGGRFVFSLAQDELLRNENFISLDLNQVGSTQPEVDVAVNVCELDGKPPLSQTARR